MSLSNSKPTASTVATYRFTDHSKSLRQRRHRRSTSSPTPPYDHAIRHWFDAFHQLHAEDSTYTPVALRLEANPVRGGTGAANGTAVPLVQDRFVYEVALRRNARGETWVVIMWEVDLPGIQFCDCVDRAEAMSLFTTPAQAAGRWHGVRLRPESRPW